MNTNMNPNELVQVVSAAAQQSDRWLFIASLVVFGVFAGAVMRYFVRQHERLIDDHKAAREQYQTVLRSIVVEQATGAAKLAASLDANTRVLEECRDELRRVREERRAV